MARSKITAATDDVITDSGSVLWSIVKGEQLEYPITLNFLAAANLGYSYEAVVVEGDNPGNGVKPTAIKAGGVQTTLVTRTLTDRGIWSAGTAYSREQYVYYSVDQKYYKLLSGTDRVSATTPDLDPLWQVFLPNTMYVQFPSTLGATWTKQPTVEYPVYGFFELRVTEPASAFYRRTWKPIRGLVELLFSPTDIVPDV